MLILTGIAGVLTFSVAAAFSTTVSAIPDSISQTETVARLAIEPLPVAAPTRASAEWFANETRIQRGDTLGILLQRLGIDDAQASAFLHSSDTIRPVARALVPGKTITAWTDSDGSVKRLVFQPFGDSQESLVVEHSDLAYQASQQAIGLSTRVALKSAVINHSLFGASDQAEVPDKVTMQLADIFGGDIDFHRDIRKGDKFTVAYEEISQFGDEIGTGRVMAAEFVNDGVVYRASWFPGDSVTTGGYYTQDGKSIRKAFLRSPLEFSRVTSGFTKARFHPVLKKWRAHNGIDYGAATGTRVRATGDGTVEFSGSRGGYGNVVILRHRNNYSTLYAHLSRIEKGARQGLRVNQGDTIGYVGSSGLASGPHLHYEFRVQGAHKNPLAMILPSSPALQSAQLADFHKYAAPLFAQIEMLRNNYQLASK